VSEYVGASVIFYPTFNAIRLEIRGACTRFRLYKGKLQGSRAQRYAENTLKYRGRGEA